jgi:hypothetical protein
LGGLCILALDDSGRCIQNGNSVLITRASFGACVIHRLPLNADQYVALKAIVFVSRFDAW